VGEALVRTSRLGRDTVLVQVRGELDMATAPALRQVLIDQVERGGLGSLLVDMAHVGFMDSTGIGALVAGYGAAQKAGVGFAVRNTSKHVLEQLRLTGLDGLFGATSAEAAQNPAEERPTGRLTASHDAPGQGPPGG
jgi:anti-sigma B factor antagonist